MNTGMNHQSLKYKNRGLLLKLICTGRRPTRVQLSKATGLTKMAVTNAIEEIMRQGYIVEGPIAPNSTVGRNPIILTVSPQAPKILALYLFREGCRAGLFDLQLNLLAQAEEPFGEETADTVMEKLFRAAGRLPVSGGELLGCGVSVIGPLDAAGGTVLNPPDFFGIRNLPLKRMIQQQYRTNVIINNDMNTAALAEKLYGDGKKYRRFLYVGISNGIGSGIISDDRMYDNGSGFAGELGHVSIDFHGRACPCGRRGCLERYISKPVVQQTLREATGWDLSFREFCEKADDPQVDRILTEMMEYLSYALVDQVNMLNPQMIYLGHEGSFLPDRYLRLLERRIGQDRLAQNAERTSVKRSTFGVLAPLYGGACLVLNELFESGRIAERG